MHSIRKRLVGLSSLLLVAGCDVADSEADVDNVDLDPQGGLVPIGTPGPGKPDPALSFVTFYSGPGGTGTAWTVANTATTPAADIDLYNDSSFTPQGLAGTISSVRISCGARAASVALFNGGNGQSGSWLPAPYQSWVSTAGVTSECAPFSSRLLDLSDISDGAGGNLNDRIRSAAFFAHAPGLLSNFVSSTDIQQRWINELPSQLPSSATATAPAIFTLVGRDGFAIKQPLTLNTWSCSARASYFTLYTRISSTAPLAWNVQVGTVYVPSGTGDAWGCRSEMQASLQSGAQDAAERLRTDLDAIASVVMPKNAAAYYFVPNAGHSSFVLRAAN